MTQKRSGAITEGFDRTPHRALLKGTGVPQEEMRKPFIGIASSFTDLIPGHTGMRDLERFIERLVPENDPDFTHTYEGPDDMPAHVRSPLSTTP